MSNEEAAKKNSVVVKVGMVGDSQIGKTSLMVKYVEGSFDEDYIQTLGVNFMEKTISIRNHEITFSIWDLGGQREFVNMLPLVCNDAVAILFMFDLSRKSTLNSIKEWYRQARGFNKTAIPFLIGTKYDQFANFPKEEQEEITKQARRFARAMKASLIFCSTSHSINVQKIFKIVLSKAFDLKCTIPEIKEVESGDTACTDAGMANYQITVPANLLFSAFPGGVTTGAPSNFNLDLWMLQQQAIRNLVELYGI
ncbi:14198_t:CDS:2 [Cetraspora pellucida]|uniref:14198_t:CDS:1 n=1 Tax=Cetraspora pellucida TaxID=1433469 RepID=A0ACA9KFI0_9GLOM|nr:14198_t:CDS:2 [Cetraspora pellucida]